MHEIKCRSWNLETLIKFPVSAIADSRQVAVADPVRRTAFGQRGSRPQESFLKTVNYSYAIIGTGNSI